MESSEVELGHLVHPGGAAHPGVVMIHDVWGLADHTRDLAGRLASEGFAVLAVDLYRRLGDVRIEDPGDWMRSLSDPDALSEIQAAVDFLAGHPATGAGAGAIGVTGFCMGGMYALLSACACRGVSAAVPFYGMLSHEHGLLYAEAGLDPARKPRQPLDAAADLGCPLLAFFGEQDPFIPVEDVEALRRQLGAVRFESEVRVYSGAGHAFMNDTRAEAYRPEAAADAWARMVAFLRRQLSA
jgi:carboxymethylenebutenolidase